MPSLWDALAGGAVKGAGSVMGSPMASNIVQGVQSMGPSVPSGQWGQLAQGAVNGIAPVPWGSGSEDPTQNPYPGGSPLQTGGITRQGSQAFQNGQLIGHYGDQNQLVYNQGQGPQPIPGGGDPNRTPQLPPWMHGPIDPPWSVDMQSRIPSQAQGQPQGPMLPQPAAPIRFNLPDWANQQHPYGLQYGLGSKSGY